MPGSPSPVGRKPGICQTSQLVTREGPEGSNPSPGAYYESISGYPMEKCNCDNITIITFLFIVS